MKKRETETTEVTEETTGAGVIAPIVATATAAFTFWWLGKYSTICERDIVGTAITVWCAVLIRVLRYQRISVSSGWLTGVLPFGQGNRKAEITIKVCG